MSVKKPSRDEVTTYLFRLKKVVARYWRGWCRKTHQFDDLMQEAALTICQALETYDTEHPDTNLEGYLYRAVVHRLMRLQREGGLIRIPQWVLSKKARLTHPRAHEHASRIKNLQYYGERGCEKSCTDDKDLRLCLDEVGVVLKGLSEEERALLTERFGLGGGEPRTFRQMGAGAGLHPQSVKNKVDALIKNVRGNLARPKENE